MSETSDLRQMSNEQLAASETEAARTLFRLRSKSQTDRLETPTEIRRNRRLIARIKTIRREREIAQQKKNS